MTLAGLWNYCRPATATERKYLCLLAAYVSERLCQGVDAGLIEFFEEALAIPHTHDACASEQMLAQIVARLAR